MLDRVDSELWKLVAFQNSFEFAGCGDGVKIDARDVLAVPLNVTFAELVLFLAEKVIAFDWNREISADLDVEIGFGLMEPDTLVPVLPIRPCGAWGGIFGVPVDGDVEAVVGVGDGDLLLGADELVEVVRAQRVLQLDVVGARAFHNVVAEGYVLVDYVVIDDEHADLAEAVGGLHGERGALELVGSIKALRTLTGRSVRVDSGRPVRASRQKGE